MEYRCYKKHIVGVSVGVKSTDDRSNLICFIYIHGKNSFVTIIKNLADADLKIIMLDLQNNYTGYSSRMIMLQKVLTKVSNNQLELLV